MRIMYFILTAIMTAILVNKAAKADTLLKYSVSPSKDLDSVTGLSIGVQEKILFAAYKLEGGIILDKRPGGADMGFASASIGVEPKTGDFYVNLFQGVGVVSGTDAYLGGHLQFFLDAGAGIQDPNTGVKLGVHGKHISNAGLTTVNRGKDMIGLQVSVPF